MTSPLPVRHLPTPAEAFPLTHAADLPAAAAWLARHHLPAWRRLGHRDGALLAPGPHGTVQAASVGQVLVVCGATGLWGAYDEADYALLFGDRQEDM